MLGELGAIAPQLKGVEGMCMSRRLIQESWGSHLYSSHFTVHIGISSSPSSVRAMPLAEQEF